MVTRYHKDTMPSTRVSAYDEIAQHLEKKLPYQVHLHRPYVSEDCPIDRSLLMQQGCEVAATYSTRRRQKVYQLSMCRYCRGANMAVANTIRHRP